MTPKDKCQYMAEEIKRKALAINDSINWAAKQANDCFDEYEKIEGCETLECEEEKTFWLLEADKFKTKIEYENKNLDNYAKEVKELVETCPECTNKGSYF